ncbi:hypothetical protein SRHO_G00030210 [Serrasalmus rhombeus]
MVTRSELAACPMAVTPASSLEVHHLSDPTQSKQSSWGSVNAGVLEQTLQLKIHEHGAVTLEAALKVAAQCERAQLALTVAAHTPVMTVTSQASHSLQSPIADLTAAVADLKAELHDLRQTHLKQTDSRLDRLTRQVAEFPWGLRDCAHPGLLPCSANTHGWPIRHPERESLHHCSCVDRCVTSLHAPTRGRQPLRDDLSPPRHRSPSAGRTGHPADLRYTFDDDSSAHLRRPRHPLPHHNDAHRQRSGYWEDFSPPRRRHDRYPTRSPSQERHPHPVHHSSDTTHTSKPYRARSPSPAPRPSLLPASGKLLEAGIVGHMSASPAQLAPPQSLDPNVDTVPAPVIRLTLSGSEQYALIDTGSGLSLITEECCKAVPALASQPIRKSFVLASSVTGHLLDMIGCITALVHIGDVTLSHIFHIVRTSSHPVILGWDFLTQHSATLSIPHAYLQILDTVVHFSSPQHLVPLQCAAIAASPVTVPPLSEMVIAVSINCGNTKVACAESYVGIVEPPPPSTSALAIARTLTTVHDGQGLVRVVNPSPEPVSLAGGCPLGQVFSLSGRPQEEYTLVSVAATSSASSCPTPAVDLSHTCLTPSEIPQLETLLKDFADVFSSHPYDYGRTDLTHHAIDTGDAKPIKLRPYRASPATQVLLQQEVDKLLEQGVIEESHSPWSAPVVLVRKKDGTHRFCVDYRRLNAVTIKDSHPLPRVDDTLDRLAGACVFSTIDLTAGYWQIPLHPQDKEKTAFSTGTGLFHFRMMPMGISNAPPSFQRLMELVLRGLHWNICLIYLDDIIVYSTDFAQHLQHLKEVFQRFRSAGLKLKPSKCHLACSSVTFLGHQVSSAGVRPDLSNTEKVVSWPVPHSATEVRAFLGLCSYYRRFIKHFSHIAEPLHRLTHKGVLFEWSPAAADAFKTLKHALTSPPILAFPNLSAPFLLYTDASLHAIGSVLSQRVAGKEHVIAYASHTLSVSERKWSTFDRELYAIVWSVRHFRHYLAFHPFTIITDHKPLVGLKKLPLDQDPTGRRARWAVELDLHDWTVVYRDDTKHLNADSMSRRPHNTSSDIHSPSMPEKTPMATTATQTAPEHSRQKYFQAPACHLQGTDSCHTSTNLVHIQADWDLPTKQRNDPDIAMVFGWLERGWRPPLWKLRTSSPFLRKFWSQFPRLRICNGLLCRHVRCSSPNGHLGQVVVPRLLVPEVLHFLHGHPAARHYGVAKTLDRALRSFYWPYMSSDISHYCRQCAACQSRRSPVPSSQAPLVSISPSRPFQIVAADITELPVSPKGNRYVLVLMDLYTKFVNLYPLQTQTAISVARCIFEQYIPQHGVLEALHSDQGRQFESDLVKHLCSLMSIHKLRTSPYHPQCDGIVERYNRTLKGELAKYLFDLGQEWDDHLPQVAMAYNTTVHASTGFTPFFLAHGRDAHVPVDTLLNTPDFVSSGSVATPAAYASSLRMRLRKAYESATAFRDRAQERQRKYYDRHLNYSPYAPGDLVLVDDPAHHCNKLAPRWIGPYEILGPVESAENPLPVVFRVRDLARPLNAPKVLHYNRLKPFFPWPPWHCCPSSTVRSSYPSHLFDLSLVA